jgi:hypothetical protein
MNNQLIEKSEKMHAFLLRFYPKRHRQEFAAEMQFVFSESLKDVYRERGELGIIGLWVREIIDISKNIVIEHVENQKGGASMKSKKINPNKAAIIGFLFTLPFIVTNFIVALRIEPIYSFLGSFPIIRNSPFFPLLLLLFFPVGAYIATRPMLQKTPGAKRKIYAINSILAVVVVAIFLILFYALSEELYRCEVLKIPNCD